MRVTRLALPVIAFALLSTPAAATSIVVPLERASTNGNTTDGSNGDEGKSFHIQTLFDSGLFESIGSPLLISQFAFRASAGDAVAKPVGVSFENVDAYLSTSARFPNPLEGPLMSTTFADNIGPDNTLVYHGALTFSSPGCTGGPCPFDLIVSFQTPFLYNPLAGNLLLDLTLTNIHLLIPGASPIDAEVLSSTPNGAFPVNQLVARPGDASGQGLEPGLDITQFQFTTPVPEPATMTLILSGLGAIAVRRRRRT